MSYALSAQLRKRFWRNQSPLVWVGREAADRELHNLVHRMAESKSRETGTHVEFDPRHQKAAILTDALGAPLAVVTMFADMLAWGHQPNDLGDGRDHLLNAIDLIQAERPQLQSAGQDSEVTSRLVHLLAHNPERVPEREEA